jgi:GH15 family glucan-1,4-alpha-glucosidase
MSGDISEAHEIALLTERYDADVSILEADAPRLTDAFDPASQTGANLAQGAIRRRVRDAAMRLVMTCEALNLAERKALAAAQAKSKDAYKAARDELVQNVMALGYVKQEATDRALQELKDRVASVLGPKGAAADPTHAPPPPSNPAPAEDPDLARMRQIDQGAA